jgi:hypothetical protein
MKANPHQPSAAALPERMIATVPSQAVPAGNPASSERVALRTVAGAACLMLIAHLWVALTRSINWDEFHYFDLIRRYAAGTLDAPLQTFHVHLFSWLLELPFEPTAQVRGGRLVMLACLGGAALATYGIAARFASRPAAALVALAWLTGGFVVWHGTAFRTDPMATVLLMASLWLLACRALTARNALVAGALAGLAALITIKSGLYAPAFAAIAMLRWDQDGQRAVIRSAAVTALSALTTFAVLYQWHAGQLIAAPPNAGMADTQSAWSTVFSEGILPRADALWTQIKLAPHISFLIAFAPLAWWFARFDRSRMLVMIGLTLPLVTVLIYRNAYPYFYVFVLPTVLVATAPAIELIVRRISATGFGLLLTLLGIGLATAGPRGTLDGQRQTIAAAKQLFPQPVTYIDFAGSLGSQNRATDFMLSGWGLKNYHARGIPELRQIMLHKTVPLLVVNHPVLDAAMAGERPNERLMDADAAALRGNYIPHWGRLYVAGKVFSPGADPIEAEFLVPGPYTLEGAALELDGKAYRPGDIISLDRGFHRIGGSREVQATLRWGKNLPWPAEAPLPVPPFDGF